MNTSLESKNITQTSSFFSNSPERKKYYLGKQLPGVYLTNREAECALLAQVGYTNRQVADAMGLSPRTVEYYLKNIRGKLGCYNKPHLIRVLNEINFKEKLDFSLNQEYDRCSLF